MSAPPTMAKVGFDPTDARFRDDPFPVFDALRARGPIARVADPDFWVVTGYEHVRSLLHDARVDAERPALAPRTPPRNGEPLMRARDEAALLFVTWLHNRAPADHERLRSLLRPTFSRTRVAARRERIQKLTDDVLDRALQRGRLDVVTELGRPLAQTIAADVVGLPEPMRAECDALTPHFTHRLSFRGQGPRERGFLSMMALAARLRALIAAWSAQPPAGDGVLWTLEQARERGAATEEEVISHGAMLLFAAYITTQYLISNGVLALLRNPDQWDLLRHEPQLIGTAVDELLRYVSPTMAVPRVALEDLELESERVRRGDGLLLVLAAANRDPAVFAEPNRLDIRRSPNPHLALGRGRHYCLGAGLARLEAEVAIGTVVRRMPPPRLETDALEWEEFFLVRGLRSLPILVEP